MSNLNHYAIGSILGSEIAGPANVGHGQIDSLRDAQRISELLHFQDDEEEERSGRLDKKKVVEAFLDVRTERRSPDLYVADPQLNKLFIEACRDHKLTDSVYVLNKTLLNARKASLMKGLKSKRTPSRHEKFAFACEFAGTELKYKLGATVDDIVCDPDIAIQFDAIAKRLAPGHTPFEYRWALLSIRKAGRKTEWKEGYKMPKLSHQFRLTQDKLEDVPDAEGVYLLFEDVKRRPLYARSTEHLRQALEQHRRPELMSAILDKFWHPDFDSFVVSYATVEKKQMKAVERRIVEEQSPIFNVSRTSAA